MSDSRAMRRRLPSPALVIASIALFVALGGAGFAASLALVKAPQRTTLISGSMSANGKLIGGLSHGTERSTGVYTLTINGNTFALHNKSFPQPRLSVTPQVITISGSGFDQKVPATCEIASETIAQNGSATAEVDCFTYDPASGWHPADAAFDFQMVGPSR
jgi:hypothetical protein